MSAPPLKTVSTFQVLVASNTENISFQILTWNKPESEISNKSRLL